jgi:hypothetical protein
VETAHGKGCALDDATHLAPGAPTTWPSSKPDIYAGFKPLQAPETATTVRRRGGKPLVQDGWYASWKEQLGGFMLELPSFDAAIT